MAFISLFLIKYCVFKRYTKVCTFRDTSWDLIWGAKGWRAVRSAKSYLGLHTLGLVS